MNVPGQVQQNQITVGSIHTNTEQTLINITEDKLRLALLEHLGKVDSKRRWHVPFGILLALVPVLLTSDFKDFWSVDKATWKAFFMFASFSAGIWLIYTVCGAFTSATLDELIQKIKNVAKAEA